MEQTITKCDNCKKKFKAYSLGSIYLTQIVKGKYYSEFGETETKELHFCSKKCQTTFK